jgi:recombination protein RecT
MNELEVLKSKKAEVVKTLKGNVMASQIKNALPKHISPSVMISAAITAVSKDPKLLECTPASFYGSLVTCSQLGLMPNGFLGEAYLLPFKKGKSGETHCQLIPGYRGLLKLVHNSGKVKEAYAEAVFPKDEFRYTKGLNRDLIHNPSQSTDRLTEKPTHFYAVLKYVNGGFDFEVMSYADVAFVRSRSQGRNNKVWDDYFEEMGKKTVLRKLLKTAPLSSELQNAVGLDEKHMELGQNQNNSEVMANSGLADWVDIAEDETFAVSMDEENSKIDAAKEDSIKKTTQQSQGAVDAAINQLDNRPDKKNEAKGGA